MKTTTLPRFAETTNEEASDREDSIDYLTANVGDEQHLLQPQQGRRTAIRQVHDRRRPGNYAEAIQVSAKKKKTEAEVSRILISSNDGDEHHQC